MRIPARRARQAAVTTLAAAAALAALAGCAGSPVQAAGGQHWQRVWTDTFNGPAGTPPDTRTWQYITGHNGFGNHEVVTNTASVRNVYLDGKGRLGITALGRDQSWTAGEIRTRRYFSAPPGGLLRVVASIRQPDPASGMGYWPAFWLLGPGAWPEHGEIDIMEDVNGLSRHSGTFHCGNLSVRNRDGTTGPCHEPNGLGTDLRPCPGCQRSFHTYGVIVDRSRPGDESIHWFLDHRQFFSLNERRVGRAAWNHAMKGGFSVLLDVAMGGDYPNSECACHTPTASTTSGGTMTVQYVSVFTRR